MDDRELIAAILAAGMVPTVPMPEKREPSGAITDEEETRILRAVGHAVALYRAVLEGLGVDPFAGLPGHDTPKQ